MKKAIAYRHGPGFASLVSEAPFEVKAAACRRDPQSVPPVSGRSLSTLLRAIRVLTKV